MATLTIVSFTVQNFHRPGTTARLKIWFGQDFVTPAGQLVMGGAVRSGSIYLDIACTLNASTHILTIPTFSLPTTDDSSVRNVRATAVLFDASGALARNLFTGWIIPEELEPTTTLPSLNAFNTAPSLPPQPMGITREQAIVLIEQGLQAEPVNGTFTVGRVPVATDVKTLADGLIADDGTNLDVQTLGSVGFGDNEGVGHASRFNIDDTNGRANIIAGGGPAESPQNEYAGMAAVAGEEDAEVFIQSTGYTNFYGHKAVSKMGDGTGDGNGTVVEIDDDNEWVKIANLPSANPSVVNQLWKDSNGFLRISEG